MDFIETIFGVAPDGGSGSLEAAIVFVPIAVAGLLLVVWRRSRSR